MNKWMYMLGIVIIAGFGILGAMELKNASTPYVTTVAEARSITDRPIQFMGAIIHNKTKYDNNNDELLFDLKDNNGDTVAVKYKGVKPANFDSSDTAVVRGYYRGSGFIADQVLVKCPSKYKAK